MVGVFFHDGNWFALGGKKNSQPRILSIGQHITGLAAADDWLNENETEETTHKTSGWLSQEPTEKQISILANEYKLDFNLTRYKASAHITFQVNKEKIRDLIKLQ